MKPGATIRSRASESSPLFLVPCLYLILEDLKALPRLRGS